MMLDVPTIDLSLSIDQAIQIAGVVGTWLAAIGTVGAVVVALWLARRGQRVRLNAHVGVRHIIGGGVSQECLAFRVTNLGDRPVTINQIGWRAGARKKRVDTIQVVSQSQSDQLPKRIDHGETALFLSFFSEHPNWISEFSDTAIADRPLGTLRALIHTSVGHTEIVRPEDGLLERLKKK